MKKMGNILLKNSNFKEIVIGDSALVRAFIESGIKVVSSYPGSPMPEAAEAIKSIPKSDRPFYFEFSVNEKVATEIAFGASINGHSSCVFMKSVGLNVASDSFVQLSMMEVIGGMVIVLGDDPGANSSQNEQDNLHYAKLSYMPVFEPSNPQEVLSMFKEALRFSKKRKMPIILRLTTHVCHAKQKINLKKYEMKQNYDYTSKFNNENGPYLPITSKVFPLKKKALNKLKDFEEESNRNKFNYVIKNNNNNDKGIIASGAPFLSLLEIFRDAKYKPDILKLGIVNPLPKKKIVKFLKNHTEVKILEELDDIIEKDIKSIAYDNKVDTKIIGKNDIEDWIGEYTPDKVFDVMKKTWDDILDDRSEDIEKPNVCIRPAQLCPGCGHRSAFYAIKKALPEDTITVGDIGCHSLGVFPPYNMGEIILCMGHSPGTASGLSIFNKQRKVVAFIGDSTLFHAGLPGIVNGVFNQHNITLIVMENGTTAMTGHQDHPGSGRNFNKKTDKIDIKKMLHAFGIENVEKIDTYNQDKLTEKTKELVNKNEFNVIIASHPCMLKFTREKRHRGQKIENKVKINQEACKKIHECVTVFGCPSIQITENKKVWVNEDLCIGDGSCIQTCPVEAIEIKDKKGE